MKPELDEPVKLKKPNRLRGKSGKFKKKLESVFGSKVKRKRKPAPAIEGYEPPVYKHRAAARMTMSDDDKVAAQFWRKGKR